MDQDKAKRLGALLYERRTALGLSIRELQARTGIDNSLILRFEQGKVGQPGPDKLARLAEALDLKLADVFAYADYVAPSQLPGFVPYLRTKFRDAPAGAVDEMQQALERIANKYGFDADGPTDGEDEAPEPTPTKTPRSKGGRHASNTNK